MNRVQHYRAQVDIGQPTLAKDAGCSQPTISHIENGGGTNIELARKIALALARRGARSPAGAPVTLDDVFPPATVDASTSASTRVA